MSEPSAVEDMLATRPIPVYTPMLAGPDGWMHPYVLARRVDFDQVQGQPSRLFYRGQHRK